MTANTNNQLINRYIEEIGHQLPRKHRSDIQEEIRSSILDMVDDRKQEGEEHSDQEILVQVLQEYGHPNAVAESYASTQYLIGPKLFPIFKLVLRILAYLFVAGFILSFIFTQGYVITIGAGGWERILEFIVGFFSGALSFFAQLVILFAILERVLPEGSKKPKLPEKEWLPSDLLKEEHSERVRLPKQIADIAVSLGLIIWFNFFPQWIGAFYSNDSGWGFIPLLSPTFKEYLPSITILLLLNILFRIILIRIGSWDWRTRWASIGLNIFSIILLINIATGSPIAGISPAYLEAAGGMDFDYELYQKLLPNMNMGLNSAIGMAALGIAISTLKKVLEVMRKGEAIIIPFSRQK